jgi:hypothetical protein
MADLITSPSVDTLLSAADQAAIRAACGLGNSNSATFSTLVVGGNVFVESDAANVLALRNGTSPQSIRVNNTFTNASNHERGSMRWVSNILTIGTEQAGTGVARGIDLVSGQEMRVVILGSTRIRMDDAKMFPNTAGGYSIGTAVLPLGNLFVMPGASVTPTVNGCLAIEATNNTTLTFKLRGPDGTVRSGTIALS